MMAKSGGLEVPWLGQIGIVVKDIDTTIDYLQKVFGIGPWAVFEGGPESCTDMGREVDFKGRMAMAQAGPVQVELIQVLEGETIHSRFLSEHGEGLHHVGFFVRNLEERLRAAREAGMEVLQRGTLKQMGLSIDYAYLDTTEIGGVVIEYIEPRFMGLPFPMRSPMVRWGARLAEKMNR